MEPYKLHKDLLLGVATASTQIEGGDTNNTWYRFSSNPSNTKDGTCSINANNHYELYRQDIKLMKKMNIEIYRMSIEWSRIEPEKGVFNEEAINHYIDEITLLQKNGIKVLVTLHHFSNPLWFEDEGGFLGKNAIDTFLEYVKYVVIKFKGLVKEYCTINEANIYAANSFLFGVWPPQRKNFFDACKVMKVLALCHIESYKLIKSIDRDTKVGFANHLVYFAPKKKSFIDDLGASFFDKGFQASLTKAMATGVFKFPLGNSSKLKGDYIDFFGINYYTRNEIHNFKMETKQDCDHNDLGWEISYDSLRELCERFYSEYKKDIYITENGTCDSKDDFRAKYIYDHLRVISDLDYVKRYYHWTFIDNFEWAEGESARFGLVECNYKTQERTIRKSGHFYSDIIKNKEVSEAMIKKYLNK